GRIASALEIAQAEGVPRDEGLQYVAMGRAYLFAQHSEGSETAPLSPGAANLAREHHNLTVLHLRASNHRNYLPRALINRAAMYREVGELAAAQRDIEEVMQIAESSSMHFYRADALLEKARVCLAQGERPSASQHLEEANRLIVQMKYRRRSRQLA